MVKMLNVLVSTISNLHECLLKSCDASAKATDIFSAKILAKVFYCYTLTISNIETV